MRGYQVVDALEPIGEFVVAMRTLEKLGFGGDAEDRLAGELRPVMAMVTSHGTHDIGAATPSLLKPFDTDAALFVEFANLSGSNSSFEWFANEFGLLEEWDFILRDYRTPDGEILAQTYRGCRLSTWREEQSAMKLAVRLWEGTELSCLEVDATENTWLSVKGLPILNVIPKTELGYVPTRVEAAQIFCARLIEHHLKGRIIQRLSRTYGGLEMDTLPQNLIGALWLQFALVLNAGLWVVNCEGCTKPIVKTRSDKKYCQGSACVKRAYRARKGEAGGC